MVVGGLEEVEEYGFVMREAGAIGIENPVGVGMTWLVEVVEEVGRSRSQGSQSIPNSVAISTR